MCLFFCLFFYCYSTLFPFKSQLSRVAKIANLAVVSSFAKTNAYGSRRRIKEPKCDLSRVKLERQRQIVETIDSRATTPRGAREVKLDICVASLTDSYPLLFGIQRDAAPIATSSSLRATWKP